MRHSLSPLVFLAFLLLQLPACGQQVTELIPRSAFFTGESRSQIQLSPAGDRVYFQSSTAPNAILSMGTESPGPIDTLLPKGRLSQFHPCKEGLVYLTEAQGIKLVCSKTGHVTSLPESATSARFLTKSKRGSERFALSITSDSSAIAGIYIFDVALGKLAKQRDLLPGSRLHFDGDLQLRARTYTNDAGDTEIEWLQDEQWQTIVTVPSGLDRFLGGFSRILSVSSDGKTIYYTSNANSDKSRCFTFDTETGHSRLLAQHDLVDLLPFAASTAADGHLTSIIGLFAKTVRIPTTKAAEADFAFLEAQLEGDVSYVGHSADDRRWLVREMCGGPTKYYVYDRSKSRLQYLLSDYPALEAYPLGKRHARTVTTRDGLQLPVHVYLPPGSDADGDGIPEEALPTVLYVHGGPWAGVAHWNQRFHWVNFQLLANRGYAVVNCEFRSSTGLGKRFADLGDKSWGTDMVNDKVDIAQWAAESGIADPERTGIWGWSYGGYATLAGLAFSPETYACGICMYGVADLEAFCRLPFADSDLWRNRVGNVHVEAERKMLVAQSPYHHLEDIKAPLMLTSGTLDQRVPQEQMDKMAVGMREQGKEVVYFYYPEEGHDYMQPESWMSFWAAAELFLADHLGGNFEAGKADFERGNLVVAEGESFIGRLE